MPYEKTLEAVNELYKAGHFRRFGIANFAAWEVAQICVSRPTFRIVGLGSWHRISLREELIFMFITSGALRPSWLEEARRLSRLLQRAPARG